MIFLPSTGIFDSYLSKIKKFSSLKKPENFSIILNANCKLGRFPDSQFKRLINLPRINLVVYIIETHWLQWWVRAGFTPASLLPLIKAPKILCSI